jgi:hypothetical protein
MGVQQCQATLWSTGLKPRVLAMTELHGGTTPMARVLQDLSEQGHAPPGTARVCVEDELLHFALTPAQLSRKELDAAVQQEFATIQADDALTITSRMSPCGRRWLSVAMPTAHLEELRTTAADAGVRLTQVSAALTDDLYTLRTLMPHTGVAVFLREEGLMLVSLVDACLTDITWERCNLSMSALWIERVNGYLYRFAKALPEDQLGDEHPPVVLVTSHAAQNIRVSSLAKVRGWTVIPLHDGQGRAKEMAP